MTLLRLEVLRLLRTRRLLALLAVFTLFGLGGPVLAHQLPDLIRSEAGDSVQVIVTESKPVDGIAIFSSNAIQLGVLITLIIAAGTLAVDARPSLAAFYRTRVRPFDRVVLPRYVVTSVAVSGSYALGAAAAWYETTILLGHLDPVQFLLGVLFVLVYLWFAVAVVVLASSLVRSVVGTVASSAATLLALPVVGMVPAAGRWLPSTLASAPVGLAGTEAASSYLPAVGVAVFAIGASLLLGLRRLRRREL
jgi:ABC-2 type transport system permease protein